jgi:hypothetical protein
MQSPKELELDRIHEHEQRRESILDERLPHRFGNRKRRRKLQSEVRKLMKNSS